MKLAQLLLPWLLPLLLQLAGADQPPLVAPCQLPERCTCSLSDAGRFLRCITMQHCISQQGMDELGAALRPEACPVERLSVSCSPGKVWPVFEIRPAFFRHPQWRRLKWLLFGSGCSLAFSQRRVLSRLSNLRDLALQFANISMDLARLSEIFCCPPRLTELLIQSIGGETHGSRIGRGSFVGLRALARLTIIFSPKLFASIDIVLNTTSPFFEFHWHGNLPTVNSNFSSLLFTNLQANQSFLEVELSNNAANFHLDGPATIVGFTDLSKLVFANTRLAQIGDSPFRAFSLKDLTVTDCGLNELLLPRLLNATWKIQQPMLMGTLALQYKLKNRTFLFDEFNALCANLPRLRHLTISRSTVSFAASGQQHFRCPQLRGLSITNCNLKDADLHPRSFSGLTQLESLRLMSNGLDTFPKEALRLTSQLTYLDLSSNVNMKLLASSLRGGILPSLATLRLTGTGIGEPLTDAFVGQPNLSELYLNDIRLVGHMECPFGKTWFNNCSSLRFLSLAKDSFFTASRCHAYGFLDPLVNLEQLGLQDCGFGRQTSGAVKSLLTRLTSLRNLQLSGNDIGNLGHIIRVRMPNLTVLGISNNPIPFLARDLLFEQAPGLKELYMVGTPIVNLDPKTFSRMPDLRIKLGKNKFACTCDLLPFADWLRLQWPIYQIETRGDWLHDAVCYTTTNRTVRLLDFRMSWWDCYNRRLIVSLASSIGALLLLFCLISLAMKYRWKLHYSLLAFCIRHRLVKRTVPSEWTFDACFIYDESDELVSQWVDDLILKLETDLHLRLYEPGRDAHAGANVLEEAASAIDRSRHAVLVLTRGFLENRLNLYSAQWSSESVFLRRRSLAVMVLRERLDESELRVPGCSVLHRLYRMCKPHRIVQCIGCGVGSNSANRLGLMLYKGARVKYQADEGEGDASSETGPLLGRD